MVRKTKRVQGLMEKAIWVIAPFIDYWYFHLLALKILICPNLFLLIFNQFVKTSFWCSFKLLCLYTFPLAHFLWRYIIRCIRKFTHVWINVTQDRNTFETWNKKWSVHQVDLFYCKENACCKKTTQIANIFIDKNC